MAVTVRLAVRACAVTGVIVCEGLRGSEFLLPLSWEDPTPIPKNLLNEVTDGESPPSQMGGEGRGRAELRRDKRRGEERRGGEGRGLRRGRVVGDVTGTGWQGWLRNVSTPRNPI